MRGRSTLRDFKPHIHAKDFADGPASRRVRIWDTPEGDRASFVPKELQTDDETEISLDLRRGWVLKEALDGSKRPRPMEVGERWRKEHTQKSKKEGAGWTTYLSIQLPSAITACVRHEIMKLAVPLPMLTCSHGSRTAGYPLTAALLRRIINTVASHATSPVRSKGGPAFAVDERMAISKERRGVGRNPYVLVQSSEI
ncbi:hypothetical protein BDN71DRAFT_1434867 [Pleurotus eryngii]|uniref:Uncharacterized protein n=1 Tax=Pleurotus eryngii TaxID=5323 RepID=A0A9P5ZMS5_PLEER|nr:hypothetical protein BDN71DRAFT_1434867 [Pleurotus eryngii]